jgi:hypothetical protein
MTDVVYTDTPNDPLVPLALGALEPINFTCQKPLQYLVVEQGDILETAYMDGAFTASYAGSSTISGDKKTVTVLRTGGWFAPPLLRPRMSQASQLQPLNYAANIVAAYALNEPGADCNLDRSGNGRHFTSTRLAADMSNGPDIIQGKACIWSPGVWALAPKTCRQTGAHWGLFGELTIAYRMFVSAAEVGAEGLLEHCFLQGQGTPPGTASVAFQSGIIGNGATPHCLYYYAERLKVGQAFISTLSVPPNRWVFVTLRRRSNGTVRLGRGLGPLPADQTYQDSGALLLPQTAAADPRYLNIGGWQDDTHLMGGGKADLVIWNRFLSDEELEPQYALPMAALGAAA